MYYSNRLLEQVKQHLKQGGIIAYPTESCYGLGCDPFNYKAISKLIRLKGRANNKGLIVIASNLSQLHNLIKPLSLDDLNKLKTYWPGFYSIILPVKANVPSNLTGKHRKIAVRITKHELVRQLCDSINMSLVSTSANYSGQCSIKTYKKCLSQFGSQVMVLPGNTSFAKCPSTIIDWETKKVLR